MLNEKSYMCFVDLEKTFDRVPRKVLEWAMRKKGVQEVLVRSVLRVQRQESEGNLSCLRSLRLK